MKRMILMMVLASGMNPFLFAGDKDKGSEMTGTICDQQCVKQDAGKAACDLTCTERSGEAAFVDDQGKTWNVANPTICMGKMGKKVKAKVKKMEDPDTLWLNSLSLFG